MTVLKQEGNYAVIKYDGKAIMFVENKRPIPREAQYLALNIMRSFKYNPRDYFVWLDEVRDDVRKLHQMLGGE